MVPGIDVRRSALMTRLAKIKIAREAGSPGERDGAVSRNRSEHSKLLSLYRNYLGGQSGNEAPISFEAWRAQAGGSVLCPKCGAVNTSSYTVCAPCAAKARREDRDYVAAFESQDRGMDP